MQIEPHDLYEQHYVSLVASEPRPTALSVDVDKVELQMSKDLPADLDRRRNSGFIPIGTSEFVGRGNMGVGIEARTQAARVGASLVVFRLTPAKLRAIRRDPDGAIDMESVLADPPAYMSPRGYFVLQSYFLAKAPQNEA